MSERYNEVMNEIRAMYCVPKSKQKMKKKGKYSPVDVLDHRVNTLGQDVEVVYEFIKKSFMIEQVVQPVVEVEPVLPPPSPEPVSVVEPVVEPEPLVEPVAEPLAE